MCLVVSRDFLTRRLNQELSIHLDLGFVQVQPNNMHLENKINDKIYITEYNKKTGFTQQQKIAHLP